MTNPDGPPKIKYVSAGEVLIIEITEHELRTLEIGDPGSDSLTIAVGLLGVAGGMGPTPFLADGISDRAFFGLLIIASLCLIVGIVKLIEWWRASRHRTSAVRTIRARCSGPSTVEKTLDDFSPEAITAKAREYIDGGKAK